ncbi:stage V sporulation protein AA [Lacrimispora algidixylanolytica]|uniref:Stage V sporulation protein AA n=1 Tax=Lacrimispora algidixylanolytica TaxID=94868 RepID=A0A419SVR8_9FIRM|nr:stage V sporulation protein AA [Lacrimispora algidixylanolytica]RKD29333.1 stage V sporulation protein AA [Lacrimispora algidixylanolytica]
MSKTVYLNINQITEVHHKEVQLKDVADVYCDDSAVTNKCKALRIKTIHEERNKRYIESTLDVIKKLVEMDPSISVNNVGEVNYIIDYHKKKAPNWVWQWTKTIFVCIVCFCGASFAIMTFNNDVSVGDVFKEIYKIVMRKESSGFTILELSYSVGLAIGIIVFFNHFTKYKFTTDPTPIEVEMRIYEDNVSETLIQNDGRKEQDIDVS